MKIKISIIIITLITAALVFCTSYAKLLEVSAVIKNQDKIIVRLETDLIDLKSVERLWYNKQIEKIPACNFQAG